MKNARENFKLHGTKINGRLRSHTYKQIMTLTFSRAKTETLNFKIPKSYTRIQFRISKFKFIPRSSFRNFEIIKFQNISHFFVSPLKSTIPIQETSNFFNLRKWRSKTITRPFRFTLGKHGSRNQIRQMN